MSAARPPESARVILFGKPGCHLCDEARGVIARVCGETGVRWEERSILADPELEDRYGDKIPVTVVDGRQHAIWRVDEQRLRIALARPPDPASPSDHVNVIVAVLTRFLRRIRAPLVK